MPVGSSPWCSSPRPPASAARFLSVPTSARSDMGTRWCLHHCSATARNGANGTAQMARTTISNGTMAAMGQRHQPTARLMASVRPTSVAQWRQAQMPFPKRPSMRDCACLTGSHLTGLHLTGLDLKEEEPQPTHSSLEVCLPGVKLLVRWHLNGTHVGTFPSSLDVAMEIHSMARRRSTAGHQPTREVCVVAALPKEKSSSQSPEPEGTGIGPAHATSRQ